MLLTKFESHLLTSAVGETHRRILERIVTSILIGISLVCRKSSLRSIPNAGAEARIVPILLHEIRSYRACTPTAGHIDIGGTLVARTEVNGECVTIAIAIVVVGSIELQVENNLLGEIFLSASPAASIIPLAGIRRFPSIFGFFARNGDTL